MKKGLILTITIIILAVAAVIIFKGDKQTTLPDVMSRLEAEGINAGEFGRGISLSPYHGYGGGWETEVFDETYSDIFIYSPNDSVHYLVKPSDNWRIADHLEIENGWSYCYMKDSTLETQVAFVSYEGGFGENPGFEIIEAWTVDAEQEKFVNIDSSEVKCSNGS